MSRTAHMTAGDRGGHLILMTRFPKASATSATRSFNPLFFPLSTWTRALSVIFHPLLHRNKKNLPRPALFTSRARALSQTQTHLANVTGGLKTKANPERAALMRLMCVCVNKQHGGERLSPIQGKGASFERNFGRVKGKSQEKRDTSFPPFAPRTLTPVPIHREKNNTS